MRQGTVYSASLCATRQDLSAASCGEPVCNAFDSAARSSDKGRGPRLIKWLSVDSAAAWATGSASPENTPAATAAAMSTI